MSKDPGNATDEPSSPTPEPAQRRTFGWYLAFIAICVAAIAAIYFTTGQDALGATARFLWNGIVFAFNGLIRVLGSLFAVIARGVGLRQISRLSTIVGSIGLAYAGSALLGDKGVKRAHGWRAKLRASLVMLRDLWLRLPLAGKIATVVVMITSQVYLHAILIIFPVAFLVPVVRRIWVQAADIALGGWYWRTFGARHRRVMARLRQLPVVRGAIGAMRLARIRYLCAWRLWRYHPRYRAASARRKLSLIEPLRLWRRGELDLYVGRPLLGGRAKRDTQNAA